MSRWVFEWFLCCSSKQFLNETHIFDWQFFQACWSKMPQAANLWGQHAGSEKSLEWLQLMLEMKSHEWMILCFFEKHAKCLAKCLAKWQWKRRFFGKILYDFWKLPIRSRMVSWNWCCSGQARAFGGLSWTERTGNVHRQLVPNDLSCKVYGLPSREPTYAFPTHFCRLLSFSQGGTCGRSRKGMWWVENLRMEKPSLLMPSCPYFKCYQLKLWDVSVSSLCLAQDLLKGMNCRISLWYTVPETNIFAPENWWYCIFRCELLVSGRVSQKPIKSWYMWKKSGLTSRSGGLLIFNSSTAQLYGRGAGPKDALKLLAAESPVTLVPAPKCRGIWRYQMLHWY